MDNKKNGIPKLRFPGFTGAWEQRKLENFLQEYSIKSKIENEYPLLSSTNKGMEYREGRTASESNIGYKILEINDLVLSPQNLWLGNININTLVTGIVSPSYKTLKINNLNLYFLLPQLKTKRMLEKYKQVSVQGASVVRRNLDFTEFMNIDLIVPENKEQKKIGNFFKQVDSLITLHQRKLEHLQEQKKGLLQKMFPKNGETIPEVRFPGFTDAWEQRKLGEILSDLYNGQTPSRNVKSYWKGDIPWLTSGELNHGIVEETIEKISESGKKAANLRLIPSGTIVIAITGLEAPGTRGNCAILGIDTTVNQSVMALVVKNNIDTQFVFQWYKKIGEEYGIRYTQGTKQQSYNYDLVKILPITIPTTTEEQQKIGSFFNQLDSLIALHQRKLEHLELMKKGLLQQMFV